MRIVAAFTCVALAATGCYHLDISPLPASPSPEQRIAAWQALHATYTETETSCTNKGCHTTLTLRLANGDQTRFADDLLPVVRPDSATARHARRAAHHRSVSSIIGLVAVGIFVGGLLAAVSNEESDNPNDGLAKAEVGVALGTGLVGAIASWYVGHLGTVENVAAFESYNKDLGESLRICAYRGMPIPCEQVAPGGAPGETLPPVTLRGGNPLAPIAHVSMAMRAR